MFLKNYLLCLTILCCLSSSYGIWNISTSLNDFLARFSRDTTKCPAAITRKRADGEAPTQRCDENQLMLQLASLYIVSPERIILLLTRGGIKDTCADIAAVMRHINTTFSFCTPLPSTNLYVKLYDGLEYFHSTFCEYEERSDLKVIEDYQECCKELREELIDCEGPPDWFEKTNETIICKYFDDIINCNYIKAATLCGLKLAKALRTFSADLINRVILFDCPVSRKLPYVDEPFPSYGGLRLHQHNFLRNYFFFILPLFYLYSIYLL